MVAVTAEQLPTVETVQIALRWTRGELGTFWLLHPPATEFVDHPPCRQRDDGAFAPLKLLSAATQADARLAPAGPAFFVIPELTLSPDGVSELKRMTAALPPNRVAIVGLGHLNQAQCDDVEHDVGSTAALWRLAWSEGRYANAAAVCAGGQVWLEAKDWPSKMEDDAACHLPHRRIRIFRGENISFAVLICSELLAASSPDAFLRLLARERVDIIFWLQHNPKPRHDSFQRGLSAFYETQGDNSLVVAVNKQPAPGAREPYGVSAMYAPSACFAKRKDNLLRPNFVVEPLRRDSGVSRAVFVRYDSPAHQVLTIHPSGVPKDSPPGEFLREVVPHAFDGSTLSPDHAPRHFQQLLEQGRLGARIEAGLEGWPNAGELEDATRLRERLGEVENELVTSANGLMNFLDTALLQREDATLHLNHDSHVLAGDCDCWRHREDFDSLFEHSMSAAVAELALAIAAMRSVAEEVNIAINSRVPENLRIELGGKKGRALLASSPVRFDEFQRRYARVRAITRFPAVIVLRSERRNSLPALANQITAVGTVNAAMVQVPQPLSIVGSELWGAFRSGRLADTLEAILGGAP